MKKISLFLSMVAFVSFVAITPAVAQKVPQKATTAQTAQPAATKACCADPKSATCAKGTAACTKGSATCTKGADCKACPADKAKKATTAQKTK